MKKSYNQLTNYLDYKVDTEINVISIKYKKYGFDKRIEY
jgi:hypothetical protein